MWLEHLHHGRQHQRQRDKGHIAGDKVKRGRDVDVLGTRPAAQLHRSHTFRLGLGLGNAFGLEGLDVLLLGVVAVVIVFVDLTAVAHPGVRSLGLGVVVFFFFDDIAQRFVAGDFQRLGGQCAGVEAFHTDHALVAAQALVQLAVAHIHTHHLGGTGLQQAVGKAARALAYIQAAQALDGNACGSQRAFELETTTRDVLGFSRIQQLQLSASRNVVTVLGNLLPGCQRRQAPLHARSNQALRL